jgi:dephospho-CoA kinase
MLNVGLTGGIGSGKSTIAAAFAKFGIPVYYADKEAKRLMNEDKELRKEIIEIFGKRAYVNGVLNRKHLAFVVFNDKDKLNRLNSKVHPAVRKDYQEWIKNQDAPYNIREAAILFESGSHKDCDLVILVTAVEEVKIQRVMERDNVSREDVLSRMRQQWDDEKKAKRSQFVIKNEELASMNKSVSEIHDSILKDLR